MSSQKLSPEQKMFMQNIVSPKPQKPLSESEKEEEENRLRQLTKSRENALNIIHGGNLFNFKEYLQTRCNKLCLFKERTDIKPIYKQNPQVKAYIDKNCQDCIKKLKEFNRALDTAIKQILPGTDPSSPTANFNMTLILLENGKAIFDALPLKFRKELEKFGPLDSEEINRLLNELEINLNGFIERSELARRRTNLLRRTRRRGGRKTKKKKRRKKNKKRKRKNKTKKRYKN
jgi:hypothetical protein